MWRTRLSKTWDWMLSRRLVGEDQRHLFFSEYISKGKPERRYVEYKDRDITNSSDRMPIEWWAWLHNRREAPPTAQEISISAEQQQILAERVAIIEAEDEKQRLRHFSGTAQEAGRAESRAQKRKNVLLELANSPSSAADKRQNTSTGVMPAPRINPGSVGDTAHNEREDPTVSCVRRSPLGTQPVFAFSELMPSLQIFRA